MVTALLALAAAAAVAQEAAIEPPRLLRDSPAQRPAGAGEAAGTVTLEVTIDAQGRVERAEVVESVSAPLDAAALAAAAGLLFVPATQDGAAVPSIIRYRYKFDPPLLPPALLTGEVRQKGKNHRLAAASVVAHREGRVEPPLTFETDERGQFSASLQPGKWRVTAAAPGLRTSTDVVELASGQRVDLRFYLEPERGAFEAVVTGERPRREVSRLDISGQELRAVPGTMGGDPFRAILSLPGVASAVSGAGFPIVRGAAPASTGWFIDGVRLPSLFHLFVLSEVIHPRFIESIEFYPSAYPAQYGQLVGGVVAAKTPTGRVDETRAEVSIDLINAGGFVETPLSDRLSLALGGRYSYAGFATWLADKVADFGASIQFWDYQARLALRLPNDGELRLFVFGAHDATEVDHERAVDTTFHRADLRWTTRAGPLKLEVAVTAGLDDLEPKEQTLWSRELDPRLLATWSIGSATVRTGFDASWKRAVLLGSAFTPGQGLTTGERTFKQIGLDRTTGLVGGAFAEVSFDVGDFTLVPALRGSYFHNSAPVTHAVLEPRFAMRYRVDPSLTLKLGTGLYHQGATLLVELPAIDVAALSFGLQRAWHTAVGFEKRIDAWALDIEATAYWSELTNTVEPAIENAIDQALDADCFGRQTCNDLFTRRPGRSMGVELMIRRRLGEKLFGWIAYTGSRTTRNNAVYGELPSILDQSHIFNAVASYKFSNGYTVGLGAQFHTGKPVSSATEVDLPAGRPPTRARCFGSEPGATTQRCWLFDRPLQDRLASFFRIDARIEKSWLYDRHTITAYADVLNATASREVQGLDYTVEGQFVGGRFVPHLVVKETGLRLVLPMIGVKGTW